ncbi:radical SAM/Cys-rich domain-containing protein [Mariprofundus aestuarium]|uniref:Radical SAM/Cys-rich domain-containing protein n=1 Tax=Mariprofundus aestuarium TaxID=1921086 RepID=A0A2K8L051_MARES|nr:arsenosugar biosynthesis radical SAM (seleno)protein ArsS [Mariprofundus aestuarium]ATX79569.1 radical SAM/Cys-rich domain-containing protein [Mariprofundus aestuarium]
MHATLPLLKESDFPALSRGRVETLQVNLGYLCNQTCLHCHVNAGPKRTELMDEATVQTVLDYLKVHKIKTLDLTGGAPEMNQHFRHLVNEARALSVRIINRCNLTILEEEGYTWLGEFLADNGVEVVASLPCYLSDNVDAQRGKGVFEKSIRALKRLNELGYGFEGSGLTLTLVYNPQGANLPPSQVELEAAYKRELHIRYGILFNQLFTITNMPIHRFGSTLISQGKFASYMQILKEAYSENNLAGVMCRSLVSIDWQGYVYDCDFNQMLDLPMRDNDGERTHLSELMQKDISGLPIVVMDHCYGCTAGQGSSCGGALDE